MPVAHLRATNEERVIDFGATLLHLALDLSDGRSLDLVAKVLSPDATNSFTADRRSDSRRWEAALMRWWGDQAVPNVPEVLDTRADAPAHEYWVLREIVDTH